MLLLIGQVPRHQIEREAFQEIDYRQMLGPLSKWVAQIDQASRIPEFINRAMRIAMSGRPGPVALALPEDMLLETADAEDLPPAAVSTSVPDTADLDRVRDYLGAARRPLLVLGGFELERGGPRGHPCLCRTQRAARRYRLQAAMPVRQHPSLLCR